MRVVRRAARLHGLFKGPENLVGWSENGTEQERPVGVADALQHDRGEVAVVRAALAGGVIACSRSFEVEQTLCTATPCSFRPRS
jgi:hypothetical protein